MATRRAIVAEEPIKERVASRPAIADQELTKEKVKHEEALHLKYRPQRLKDVIGHDAVIESIQDILKAKARPQAFLFSGPAGTGKTTLARILAGEFEVEGHGVLEVDAATKNGVDDVRAITEDLRYKGFGKSPNKAIILNECQRLSPGAWDALLMSVEEPPPHVFFFFTTTHVAKVPKAVVTRCQHFHLKDLGFRDVMDLLEFVCEQEKYDTPNWVLEMVAGACGGSMRGALTMLSRVYECDDEDEARQLLQVTGVETPDVMPARFVATTRDLCRKLLAGKLGFDEVCSTLEAMDKEGVQPESVRLALVKYLNRRILSHDSEKEALRYLDIQDAFMKPATGPEKLAPLLQAFGRAIFGSAVARHGTEPRTLSRAATRNRVRLDDDSACFGRSSTIM